MKQEFVEQRSSNLTAYFRPGTNAVQLISPAAGPSSNNVQKIQIELTIRIESSSLSNQKHDEDIHTTRRKTIEQINNLCLAELKEELKNMSAPHSYSTILSEQAIKDLVKLMP